MALLPAFAFAGGAADLIALDKVWGEARQPDEASALISDKLVAIDQDGVSGKAELMESLATGEPSAEPYVAGDYAVEFLDTDTAVMVHSAGTGEDTHWSLHVWKKSGGKWQVVATASIPSGD
jgi:hypothetical protein